MNPKPFLSCDWGTTRFRLRWMDPGLKVSHEVVSDAGSRALFEKAPEASRRSSLFEDTLREALVRFPTGADRLPLVISGMASSSVGWREVPYQHAPLRLDGSNLRFEEVSWAAPELVSATFLLSGVAVQSDMMRGEETEAIGVLAEYPVEEGEELTLILPGTHSKHLRVQNGTISAVATFMTGELFDVLSRHSLLKATVDPTVHLSRSEQAEGSPEKASAGLDSALNSSAFQEGVHCARERGLARSLFRTRTRGVLEQIPGSANAAFLSGLLIGSELEGVPPDARVLLAAAGPLATLYSLAFATLEFPTSHWTVVPQVVMELAVPRGQALFLCQQSVYAG